MFDTYYSFNKVGLLKPLNNKYLEEISTYSFKSTRNYYLVEVEKYAGYIYVLKYYLKKDKQNPDRFNILTHENRGAKVISTCVRIMLEIFDKNNLASFGFVGSNTITKEKNYKEAKEDTKRFRIYKKVMYALLGTETFTHYYDTVNSTYLMINNHSESVDGAFRKARDMFEEIFPVLS